MSELISKNLKSLREQLGYTPKNVAEKIGVKSSTISGYESGARTHDPNKMVKLANV